MSCVKFARHAGVAFAGLCVMIASWATYVELSQVPRYILPGPSAVAAALVNDWAVLGPALWVTTQTSVWALLLAVIGGGGAAVILAQSRWIEMLIAPVTVFLQVTPIVAIAPLILIYVPDQQVAQLGCAFLVTFFPIMVNTLQGLKSADRDLADTVLIYTASKWKMLVLLQIPSALPSFFAGLKIGGGLALVGAVVAEFAAGTAGANSGLAFRLLEAQYRLNTPRLFAALALLALLGATIFLLLSAIDRVVLRHWYASKSAN
ncbi:ABC transporter permease [Agrobacterium genomosp. 3]|uniref:ABC transporter permease n=1 Tax=Agrobacterium tomkonis TaxID=1183410 RepID=UPI001FA3C82B|nr:ABC transporter permease [Agrobacterium tomkonis]MCA1879846.1 ABC transporter permease [Agrobacterium tumefaciens]MCA1895066.1 ABC transporter permease [Agrobacterium tomkonis]